MQKTDEASRRGKRIYSRKDNGGVNASLTADKMLASVSMTLEQTLHGQGPS